MEEITKVNYEQTVALLNEAAGCYYAGKPTKFSDEVYDAMIDSLRRYEEANGIKNPNSPTQKVNEGTADDKIIHVAPMLSLRDVFNKDSLEQWVGSQPLQSWCVEEKIDGLSMEFVYNQGKLERAVTRGNGYKGADVTAVVKEIPGLPSLIPYTSPLTIRGEVYMPYSKFNYYIEHIGKAANPRNLAVGLVKRKDDVSGAKFLSYFMFNVQHLECNNVEDWERFNAYDASTHTGRLWLLKSLGFIVVKSYTVSKFRIWEAVEDIKKSRENLEYGIDGAVIKANNLSFREQVGDDGAVPRWAVAFKYPAKEVETEILSIQYQLGKTGRLTPVAIVKPVDLDGSTVSRCTLHNRNRMVDLGYVRPGDIVTMYKAGDIIPAIKSAKRGPNSLDSFSYPTVCPCCGGDLEGGEICINIECPQKSAVRMHHWASKSGVDLAGISASTVQTLIDRRKIKNVADYYKLKPADLLTLPRFGRVKINKTLSAIHDSLKSDFGTVLTALCIENLGFSSAYKLTEVYPTWDTLLNADVTGFQNLIGNVTGEKVYATLHSDYYLKVIEELKEFFPFNK